MRSCAHLSERHTNTAMRKKMLESHVVVRCRPLTAEEWGASIVRSSSSLASRDNAVALTYPVAVHRLASLPCGEEEGEKEEEKGAAVAVTTFAVDGELRTQVFEGVFDAVFLPQVVECLARLRHRWNTPPAGATPTTMGENVPGKHCYNTALDLSTVSGSDAVFVMQALQAVVMQSTVSHTTLPQPNLDALPLLFGAGSRQGKEEEDEEEEEDALQRHVEQLSFLDPLCLPRRARGNDGQQGSLRRKSGRVAGIAAPDVIHMLAEGDDTKAPIVPLLLSGHHVAVLVYGPPQSGKTHTLFGTLHPTSGAHGASGNGATASYPAHAYTPGLITHVVRHLEDRVRRRQRQQQQRQRAAAFGASLAKRGAERDNDDGAVVYVALVAFQEESSNGATPAGGVTWELMYDLWNPESFVKAQRTVRLTRLTPPDDDAATGGGIGGDGDCHPAHPLAVEDAVWLIAHSEGEMTLYQQRGMENLVLLRERLGVNRPLHVALLMRTTARTGTASGVMHGVGPFKATSTSPPYVFYAECVFIELHWTPRVASGAALREALRLPPVVMMTAPPTTTAAAAAAPSSLCTQGSALSLLLQPVQRGNAKLFLVATVHASPLHAMYTMDALYVAATCKQSSRHPLQMSLPCVHGPSLALRPELKDIMARSETIRVARLSNKALHDGDGMLSDEMCRWGRNNKCNKSRSDTPGAAVQPSEEREPMSKDLRSELESLEEYLDAELNAKRGIDEGLGTQRVAHPTGDDHEVFVYPNDLEKVQRVLQSAGWGYSHLLRPALSISCVVGALIDTPPSCGSCCYNDSNDKNKNSHEARSTYNGNSEDAGLHSLPLSSLSLPSSYVVPCMGALPLDRDLRRFLAHPEERCTQVPSERLAVCHKRLLLLELLNFVAEVARSRLWKPDGPTVPSHICDYKELIRGVGPTFREAIDQCMLKEGAVEEGVDPPLVSRRGKQGGRRLRGVEAQFQTIHTLCGFDHLQRLKRVKAGVFSGENTTAFVPTTVAIRGHFMFYFDGEERPHLSERAKGGCYLLGATIVAILRRTLENRCDAAPKEESVQTDGAPLKGKLKLAACTGAAMGGVGGRRVSSPSPFHRSASVCHNDGKVAEDGNDDACSDGDMRYFIEIIPSVPRGAGVNDLFDTRENHLILGFHTKSAWRKWKLWLNRATLPVPSARLQRHFALDAIEDAAISSFAELQLSRLHLMMKRGEERSSVHAALPWHDKCFHDTGRPLPLTACELRCVIGVLEEMTLHHTYARATTMMMMMMTMTVATGNEEEKRNGVSGQPVSGSTKSCQRLMQPAAPFEEIVDLPLSYLRRKYASESSLLDAGLRRAVHRLFDVFATEQNSSTDAYNGNNMKKKKKNGADRKTHLDSAGDGASVASHRLCPSTTPHIEDVGALAAPSIVLPLRVLPFATQLRTSFVTYVRWRRGVADTVKGTGRASSARAQTANLHSACDNGETAPWWAGKPVKREEVQMEALNDAEGDRHSQTGISMSYRLPFRHTNLLDLDHIYEQRYASHVWLIDHFAGTIACATSAPIEEDPHLRRCGYIRSAVYQSHELLHVGRCDSFSGDDDDDEARVEESRVTDASSCLLSARWYGVVMVFYRGHHIIYNEHFVELQERERFMECTALLRPTIRTFAPAFTTTLLARDEPFEHDVGRVVLHSYSKNHIPCDINLRAVMPTTSLACVSRFWSALLQQLRKDGLMNEESETQLSLRQRRQQQQQQHRHRHCWRERSLNLKIDATLLNGGEYRTKKKQGLAPFATREEAMQKTEHDGLGRYSGEPRAHGDLASSESLLTDAPRHQHEEEEEEEMFSVKLEGVCGLQVSGEATLPLTLWTGTVNLDGLPMENPVSLRKWLDLLAPQWRMASASSRREEEDVEDVGGDAKEGNLMELLDGHAVDAAVNSGDTANLPYDMIVLTAQEVSFHRTPARFITFVQSWFEQQGYVAIATAALNTAVVLFVFARQQVACLCGAARIKKIPLSFTALHGERGAVVVTVDIGQSPVCFVAVYLHTLASHTALQPLTVATHCALIQEVLSQIPGGARGCFLQPAQLDTGKSAVNDAPELTAVRDQTITVDGLEYYDLVFLIGYWGMPLLLSSTETKTQEEKEVQGAVCDRVSRAIAELVERLRVTVAEEEEEDTKKKMGDGFENDSVAAAAAAAVGASGSKHAREDLPSVVSELLRGHDILTVLRDASLLLSRGCGVVEAMPEFLPSSGVVPGTTRYDLQFLHTSAAEAEKGAESGEVDGVFFAYPSRILYKCGPCDEMRIWQVTPRAYGSLAPMPPPAPIRRLRDPYRHLAVCYHRKMQRNMRRREAAEAALSEILLSKHLPVSATFTLHVLRPCIGGTFWGREEPLQPGGAQSWLLRLRRLAMQLPVQAADSAARAKGTASTRERCIAIAVQFVPFLCHPVLIVAREVAGLTGATAVLLHRRTRRIVDGHDNYRPAQHTTPACSLECLVDDYSIDPIQSPPSTIPAVADLALLPHHAVVLAHAKMLLSVFDCGGGEAAACLVGSATLPLVDIMRATVRHAAAVNGARRWENDATYWTSSSGAAAAAQDVELPPLDVPLHRCGRCVGTIALVCSPLMCTATATVTLSDDDLL